MTTEGPRTDAEVLWRGCAALLREQVSSAVWNTSFLSVQPVGFDGLSLRLAFPSALIRDRVQDRYLSLLQANLKELGYDDAMVSLEVAPPQPQELPLFDELTEIRSPEPTVGGPATGSGFAEPVPTTPAYESSGATSASSSDLNDRYTFATFVTGGSNRFAHAAALRVAEQPAQSYNPLFVHGDPGLGKTHLLQAIGNYVRKEYPHYRVRYVTSEQFLSEFVDSIRTGANEAFKRRFRDIDVLLVDDVQFFADKKETQEEFFHTFNHLYQNQRQIVLSSDRPPNEIPTLEDRLRTRFVMGLLTDIQPPDEATRLAILRKKAEADRSPLPAEVLAYIAANINDNNIRALEGALTRLSAWASLESSNVTIERAAEVIEDLISDREARPITPDTILMTAAEYFGVSVDDLVSKARNRPIVDARHVTMYLFRELTDLSFPSIGEVLGGRDHTTVIYGVDKVKDKMKDKQVVFSQVQQLIQRLKADG